MQLLHTALCKDFAEEELRIGSSTTVTTALSAPQYFPVQVQGGKHFITCPVCRQTTQQPFEWIPVSLPHQQLHGAPSSARKGVWVPAE